MIPHSWLRRVLLLPGIMLIALSSGTQTPARNPARAAHAPAKFRIAGTVVNAATGDAIPRATIALLAESDSHTLATTLTDSDGHFSIDGLDADKYQLTAAKRGYQTAFFDEHEEYSSAIVTGSKTGSEVYINVENLKFKMTPGGLIHGVVMADTGDPVEDATVRLYQRRHDHGTGARIVAPASVKTDDTGAYEFGGLAPGDYMIAVTATPWYAQGRGMTIRAAETIENPNNSLDVTYPTTYYDSTTDEGAASAINIAGGNRVEANITLHAVQALHLTLPALQNGSSEGDLNSAPQLTQLIFGSPAENEILVPENARGRGASEFTGIAPGVYRLEEGNPPRTVTVNVQNSQQIDTTGWQDALSVSGRIIFSASNTPLPESMNLALEESGSANPVQPIITTVEKGNFNFPEVPPGHWTLWAASGDKTIATLAITIDGISTAGGDFTVQQKPLKLDVTLSQDLVRVNGIVLKDGKGFPGAMVVLVPNNPAALHALVRRDQSDSDGTFSLKDVAPGRYTVLAIEDGWSLDWAKPAVLDRYLSGGIPVTLRNTQSGDVRLDAPVTLQQR